jgi:hypothetical protein
MKEKDKNIGVRKEQIFNISENIKGELELPDDTHIAVSLRKNKIPNAPEFSIIWNAVGLLVSKNLNSSAIHVLYCFMNLSQYSNHIGIDQKTIAENTNLSLATIERAIKELKEANIILPYQDVQDRRRNVYIINDVVMWKGKLKNIPDFRKKAKENKIQLDLNFDGFQDIFEKTKGMEIYTPSKEKNTDLKITKKKGQEEDFIEDL